MTTCWVWIVTVVSGHWGSSSYNVEPAIVNKQSLNSNKNAQNNGRSYISSANKGFIKH